MTDTTKNKIRTISRIVLSCLLWLTGVCLIAACVGIYLTGGDEPFSPEAVAQAFQPIAWIVWLCLAGIVGAFAVKLWLPVQEKTKPEKQLAAIVKRLRATRDLTDQLQQDADQLANQRKHNHIVGFCLLAVGSLAFLLYACNGRHFLDQDINRSVIAAVWRLLACMGVPFAWAMHTAYADRKSMEREIALLQSAPKRATVLPETPKKPLNQGLRWGLLAVGIIVLLYGFLTGGTLDVLTKAINICTECVGLG